MGIGVCAVIMSDNTIQAAPYEPMTNCAFALVSTDEYQRMISASNLEFQIDKGMFSDVVGYLLLSFLSGHILGRIVKALGKG